MKVSILSQTKKIIIIFYLFSDLSLLKMIKDLFAGLFKEFHCISRSSYISFNAEVQDNSPSSFFFLMGLGFELKASPLQSRNSIA
jgi:hypothetical protein